MTEHTQTIILPDGTEWTTRYWDYPTGTIPADQATPQPDIGWHPDIDTEEYDWQDN